MLTSVLYTLKKAGRRDANPILSSWSVIGMGQRGHVNGPTHSPQGKFCHIY